MAVCPNKNSKEWKALEEKLGLDGAYRVWLENNKTIPNVYNIIKPRDEQLITQFTQATNSVVLIDKDMTTPGRGEVKPDGKIVVYINPDILERDTIIHEFAHVYIELLGGMNHPLIKAGLKRVKDSDLYREILQNYPELIEGDNLDKFHKEVVATSLGRTGEEIFNSSEKSRIERFNAWVKGAIAKLKRMLGMSEDAIKQMANEILQDRLRKDEFISPEATEFQQKSKKSAENAIAMIKEQSDFFTISEDENFYIGKEGTPFEYKENADGTFSGLKIERQSKYAERVRGKSTEVNEPMKRGAHIGNFFDDIGRDVFKLIFFEDETALQTKQDYLAAVNIARAGKPKPEHTLEVSDDVYNTVIQGITDFAKDLKGIGFTAEPEKMFVYSLFADNIQKELGYSGMGGTLDLLVRDPEGGYHIIDFKNSRFTGLGNYNKNLYQNTLIKGKEKEALVLKWGVQQTIYKVLTENYSSLIDIKSINALVFSPDYTNAVQTQDRIVLKEFKMGYERSPVEEVSRTKISPKLINLTVNKKITERVINDIEEGTINTQQTIDDSVEGLDEREKLIKKVIDNIKRKIKKLENVVKDEDDINQATINRLSSLIREMTEAMNSEALFRYVKQAYKEINEASEALTKIDEIKVSKDALKRIYFIDVTNKSFDMQTLVDISEEFKNDEEFIHVTSLAREAIALKHIIDSNLYNKRIKLLARLPLLPHDKILAEAEEKAERIFNSNNFNLKGEERKTKQREFIEEYVADNAEEINKKSEEHRENIFKNIPKDLSYIEAYAVNPKDQNSELVDMLVYLAEIADFKTRDTFFGVLMELEETLKAYEAFSNVSQGNQKEFYRPFLREEGGMILPELITQGDTAKYAELKKGKYKGTPAEDLYDLFIRMSSLRDANLTPIHKLGNKLPTINKTGMERVLEDGLIAAVKRGVEDKFKLNTRDDSDLGTITSEIEDFTHKLTDTKRVIVNEANEEKAFVPIHYRGKIEDNDRSFDVSTLLLLDLHQAANYHNKTEALYIAESIRETIADARTTYTKRSGMLGKIKVGPDGEITGEAALSNTLFAMDNVIRQRFYGQQYVGDPQMIKLFKGIKAYSSFVMLSLNYMSAGANYFHGNTMAFIEGVGGEHYTVRNTVNAKRHMLEDYGNVLNDVNRRVQTSKTLIVTQKINARNEFDAFANNMSKDNRIKNFANFGSFYMLNAGAEFSPQTLLMHSLLDNIKVFDKDGNFLTQDGKPTKERDGAMSWYEAVEVGHRLNVKHRTQNTKYKEYISSDEFAKLQEAERSLYSYGSLVVKPGVVSSEIVKGADILSDSTVFAITRKAGALNRFAFGNYSNINKSYAQATAVGMLINHMRGFMMTGIMRRFRGMNTVYIRDDNSRFGFRVLRNDEIRTEDKYLNQETGRLEQGMYATTARYFGMLVKDLREMKFQLKGEKWNELTDHEKSNVTKTITELGIGIATLLGAIALMKMADDEDDEDAKTIKLLAAFYSRRLYSELFFYTNPVEALRIFKSPAVSISLIDGMVRALTQVITGPGEIYQTGRFKDQSKLKVKVLKLTPLKAFQRDVESALNFFNY